MALNLSRDSIFPMHRVDDSLFSAVEFVDGYRLEEGCPDKSSTHFGNYRDFDSELENSQHCMKEKTEKSSDNILDSLPSDPFGMSLSNTFTAISGLIEDIGNNFGLNSCCAGIDRFETKRGEDQLLAGLNLVWKSGEDFHPEVDISETQEGSTGCNKEMEPGLCDNGLLFDNNVEEFKGFCYEKYWVSNDPDKETQGCTEICSDGEGGAPQDALLFALGYLGVQDLLSVERVCKTLRDAVRNDPLIWRNIRIHHPLSGKITDDALLQLTSRAQGTLRCLTLVDCFKITDGGLKNVLECNPGMIRLSVPGCVRLTVEGILCSLKALKSTGKLGIRHLGIAGLYGITNKQFEELKFLLGADSYKQLNAQKPRFYSCEQLCLTCDDDRAIDIEPCPRCEKLRQVYDCPAETCQGKHNSASLCRACLLCIARCINCGRCIDGCDYEETFCLDLLCSDCWNLLLNCQNRQEDMGIHFSMDIVFHQQASYYFCLDG